MENNNDLLISLIDDCGLKESSDLKGSLAQQIVKIYESKDKEELKNAYRELFAIAQSTPKIEVQKRTKPILWTASGLSHAFERPENKDLLELKFEEYYSDSELVPFKLAWRIMESIGIAKFNEDVQVGTIIKEILALSKEEYGHIEYDKILSELFVEEIPVESLRDVRIAYGQDISNRKKSQQGIVQDHIFASFELPCLLARVAKYNVNCVQLGKAEEKISLANACGMVEFVTDITQGYSDLLIFKPASKSSRLIGIRMQDDLLDLMEGVTKLKGDGLTLEEAKKVLDKRISEVEKEILEVREKDPYAYEINELREVSESCFIEKYKYKKANPEDYREIVGR